MDNPLPCTAKHRHHKLPSPTPRLIYGAGLKSENANIPATFFH
ncbi:hypothetical protein yrohd0001_28440 [Yersinia rohdei ATCC 43380]|nr:hypothetical protein yrohd0001_28440 [Yersinia rohdei ATCC 43380]